MARTAFDAGPWHGLPVEFISPGAADNARRLTAAVRALADRQEAAADPNAFVAALAAEASARDA